LISDSLIQVAHGMAQASLSTGSRSHLLLPTATLVHPCTSAFSRRREKGWSFIHPTENSCPAIHKYRTQLFVRDLSKIFNGT